MARAARRASAILRLLQCLRRSRTPGERGLDCGADLGVGLRPVLAQLAGAGPGVTHLCDNAFMLGCCAANWSISAVFVGTVWRCVASGNWFLSELRHATTLADFTWRCALPVCGTVHADASIKPRVMAKTCGSRRWRSGDRPGGVLDVHRLSVAQAAV